MPPGTPPEDRLARAIAALEKKLERTISTRRQGKREITPEHRRVLGVIHEALGELRRLHALKSGARPYDVQALDQAILELVEGQDIDTLSIAAAWEYVLSLQRLLLLIGDRHYVKAQLMSEWRGENAPAGHYLGKWSFYFEKELLEDLKAKYKDDAVAEDSPTHRQAVEYLTYLSVERNGRGRAYVMNTDTRTLYLDRLTQVLAGLLLLVLLIIYIASNDASYSFAEVWQEIWKDGPANFSRFRLNFGSQSFRHALAAAVFGATGSLLSGFYTLRDKAKHLNDLRSFRSAMWAQPFVGATAGVLVYLIVMSGIIGLAVRSDVRIEWAAFAVYGFLAGFSEPFFLGLVSRVASTADKESATAGAAPPSAGGGGGGGGGGERGGGGGGRQPITSPPIASPPVTSPPVTSPDEPVITSPDEPFISSPPDEPIITSPPEEDVITSPPDDDVIKSP